MRVGLYAPRPIGRALYWLIVRPRAQQADWQTLRSDVQRAAEAFDTLFEGVNPSAAALSVQGYMCLCDQIAHITTANCEIVKQLHTIKIGQKVARVIPELFPAASARPLEELRQAHRASVQALRDATAEPLPEEALGEHPVFFAMRARDWLGLLPLHYDYHTKQIHAIQRSQPFRAAQERQAAGSRQ